MFRTLALAPKSTPVAKPALQVAACAAVVLALLTLASPAAAARPSAALPEPVLAEGRSWSDTAHLRSGRDHGQWQIRRHHHRRHHSRGPLRWGPPRHALPRHHGPAARACHPVTRVHFSYGRRLVVGHIQCYDRRGRAYLRRGSRFVVPGGFH